MARKIQVPEFMNADFAKKMAEARGYHFYWDSRQQSYVCYPTNDSAEASYHTKSTLSDCTPEQFEELYLPMSFNGFVGSVD